MQASDTAEFALAGIADFELTDAQFHRIRALVREHTGIALSDAKRQLVYGRLSRRLRAADDVPASGQIVFRSTSQILR